MIIVQETTKAFPDKLCHVYFLTDDKFHMLGYIPYGTSEPKMNRAPVKFDTRGRTFKTLKGK